LVIVSEVLIHCFVSLLFLDHSEAEHHGGEGFLELTFSSHGSQEAESKTGRCRACRILFKGMPIMTYFIF
jgi:hypothetical protein